MKKINRFFRFIQKLEREKIKAMIHTGSNFK
jgi:hypothetical protein